MSLSHSVEVGVNGLRRTAVVCPWTTLADMLRDTFGLYGTRVGCGEGVCGSCTVLIDGGTARSCLTLAAQVDGCEITTIESYADDPFARELQEEFVEHFAAQCGFCTSGMLAVALEYLNDDRIADHADETTIRAHLDAVACRCTGYQPVVAAVKAVARRRAEDAHA